jgi:histidinol phosphatase-like enzyme
MSDQKPNRDRRRRVLTNEERLDKLRSDVTHAWLIVDPTHDLARARRAGVRAANAFEREVLKKAVER